MNSPSEPEKGKHGNESDSQSQSRQEPAVTAGNEPAGGWLENLAQRSTGLPAEDRPNKRMESKGDTGLWRLAGLGIQFAATVAIFAWMGNALDKRMGWSPWGLVSLSLIAVVGNLYLLIKETLKQDSPSKQRGENNVSSDSTKKRSPPAGGSGSG